MTSETIALKSLNSRDEVYRRAGQTMETGFFDAIAKAYANSTHSPASVILKLAVVVMIFAQINNSSPLSEFHTHIKNNPSDHSVFKVFQTTLLYALSIMSKNPNISLAMSLLLVNVSFKPSYRNALIAIVILGIFAVIPNWTVYEYAVICESVYLFMVIRNPAYKFVILMGAFLYIILDQDLIRHFTDKPIIVPQRNLNPATPSAKPRT